MSAGKITPLPATVHRLSDTEHSSVNPLSASALDIDKTFSIEFIVDCAVFKVMLLTRSLNVCYRRFAYVLLAVFAAREYETTMTELGAMRPEAKQTPLTLLGPRQSSVSPIAFSVRSIVSSFSKRCKAAIEVSRS